MSAPPDRSRLTEPAGASPKRHPHSVDHALGSSSKILRRAMCNFVGRHRNGYVVVSPSAAANLCSSTSELRWGSLVLRLMQPTKNTLGRSSAARARASPERHHQCLPSPGYAARHLRNPPPSSGYAARHLRNPLPPRLPAAPPASLTPWCPPCNCAPTPSATRHTTPPSADPPQPPPASARRISAPGVRPHLVGPALTSPRVHLLGRTLLPTRTSLLLDGNET